MVEFFTDKQKELIRKLKRGELRRLNILYGSVRSGKTWITLVLFAIWVAGCPKDKTFLMCARTLTTLRRNCLDLLQEIIGKRNFSFSLTAKTATLFGRKVYLEGANDSRSEGKIRGMTLQGAYVDEITLIERDFFAMLLSRLSEKGAKLFGSTNPDNPGHWLKKEYIDRAGELDMYVGKFEIDDNTFLDPDYIRQIKSEYTGVFYDRFIRGEFAAGMGLVYPMYEEAVQEPPDSPTEVYCLSIDYGTQNAFAALLWAQYNGVWWAIREYYYSGRERGVQKTDEEYAVDLDEWRKDVPGQLKTIIDPSAASFIALLRKRKQMYKAIPADNDVANGIIETARAMHTGAIKISLACKNWIVEVQGYVWDEKALDDRPVKVADHCLAGDTLVITGDGKAEIKDLVGSEGYVWSYNVKSCAVELKPYHDCRMTQEEAEIWEIQAMDGRVIRCTGDHPVLTKRGYVLARDLLLADEIVDIGGALNGRVFLRNAGVSSIGIKAIRKVGRAPVFNMEVEENHNFAIEDGLIVHNCMDSMRYFVKTMGVAVQKTQYAPIWNK